MLIAFKYLLYTTTKVFAYYNLQILKIFNYVFIHDIEPIIILHNYTNNKY